MVNVVYQTGIAFAEPPAFNKQLSEISTHYHLPRKKYATILSTQDFLILRKNNHLFFWIQWKYRLSLCDFALQ